MTCKLNYYGSFKLFIYLFIHFFFFLRKDFARTKSAKSKDATKQKQKTLQANSKGMVVPAHQ